MIATSLLPQADEFLINLDLPTDSTKSPPHIHSCTSSWNSEKVFKVCFSFGVPAKSPDWFWWGAINSFTLTSISTMHVFLCSISLENTAHRDLTVAAKLKRLQTPRYWTTERAMKLVMARSLPAPAMVLDANHLEHHWALLATAVFFFCGISMSTPATSLPALWLFTRAKSMPMIVACAPNPPVLSTILATADHCLKKKH